MKRFLFLALTLFMTTLVNDLQAQIRVEAEGCVRHVNIPAEYANDTRIISTPEIVIQVESPVYTQSTIRICTREAAIEEYQECTSEGVVRTCTREIPAIYENVIVWELISPGRDSLVQVGGTRIIDVRKKVKDGYVGTVPCEPLNR